MLLFFSILARICNFWHFSTAWYGTVRYSSLLGVFHWVQYLVPRRRFQAIRTIPKTWRVNSTDHWLAEKIDITTSLNLRHDTQHRPARFKTAQPAKDQRKKDFCLDKCTFLYQPKNSCFVVYWGSTDVPLVDSRGADPARWGEAE